MTENTDFESAEDYRESYREYLISEAESEAELSVIFQLINQLVDVSTAEVSAEEVAEEVWETIQAYQEEAEAEGMDYDEYAETYFGMTADELQEDLIQTFLDSDREDKILRAFAEAEDVDISDEAFDAYMDEMAEDYDDYETGEELYEAFDADGYGEYLQALFMEYQVGYKLMEISEEE